MRKNSEETGKRQEKERYDEIAGSTVII